MRSSEKANTEPTLLHNRRMIDATASWISRLDDYPGWKEWNRQRLVRALYDDLSSEADRDAAQMFVFSDPISRQHAVVYRYLSLQQTVSTLKDCEYYFRRFPFHGLPVTHSDHVTYICEMYFGRFYEFRERLKKYLNVLSDAVTAHRIDIGRFIKLFDKEFEDEIKARHSVHHHERFEDRAIDRIYLAHVVSLGRSDDGWKRERQEAYRTVTREWAARVRMRAAKLDQFMEGVAQLTLSSCEFLEAPSDKATEAS